jgi:hypothetical protein
MSNSKDAPPIGGTMYLGIEGVGEVVSFGFSACALIISLSITKNDD